MQAINTCQMQMLLQFQNHLSLSNHSLCQPVQQKPSSISEALVELISQSHTSVSVIQCLYTGCCIADEDS